MQTTNPVNHPEPTGRRRLLTVPFVLTAALLASACSSGAANTQDTSTTVAPVTTSAPTTVAPTTTEPAAPSAEPAAPPSGDELAAELAAELEIRGFSGVVAIQSGDELVTASAGSADRSAGVDNDVDTVFDIGSLTKQFTAAAILRLEMDGELSVGDTIGQYVDGLSAEQSDFTLHQLLTHSSGFPRDLGPDDEVIGRADYLDRVSQTPPFAEPDEMFHYSNAGYSLLGAVIEAVTGDSYEVYLREALFEPAGMAHTGYVLPDWDDATIAVGYDGDDVFGRPNEQPWDVDGPGWNLRANGGILSTIPDLLRWDEALRGESILDAEAKGKLFAPHVVMDTGDVDYGYGWVSVPLADGATLITHNGGNGVFFADFLRFVDHDLTIILASNTADPNAGDLAFEIAEQLLPPSVFGD